METVYNCIHVLDTERIAGIGKPHCFEEGVGSNNPEPFHPSEIDLTVRIDSSLREINPGSELPEVVAIDMREMLLVNGDKAVDQILSLEFRLHKKVWQGDISVLCHHIPGPVLQAMDSAGKCFQLKNYGS